ncbi:MAG: hypothetical protein QME94_17345, partial [Anaerolineae bacterium]|nr:hypothetical protein [Anaerolineae bacterium]
MAPSASPALSGGGPDGFGYTWSEATFEWIDAVDGGTDTGLGSSSSTPVPVSTGFPFRYYNDVYSEVYVGRDGFLSVLPPGEQCRLLFPDPDPPNGMIHAYHTYLTLSDSGPTGRVYYKRGGTTPNRYLVVEWYQVRVLCDDPGSEQVVTFEVVLHESEEIVLQYGDMQYNDCNACASVGIEDQTGADGALVTYCACCALENAVSSNTAIHFAGSAPAPRVRVSPHFQGGFAAPGGTLDERLFVRNIGEVGPDTYDVLASSVWPVQLYREDGTTALTDTDGDGLPDTGSLAETDEITVTARVSVPAS